MNDEPVAEAAPHGGGARNPEGAAGPAHPADTDAAIRSLTAALEAARAECREAVTTREKLLDWVRELEAAVRERDNLIEQLRAALRDRDRRVDELAERLERTQVRINDIEHSLERTVELQRSLEAEFDQARRAQDQTASVLAASREDTDRSRTALAERDAQIKKLQSEVARRGQPGSPAAVGTALVDLFRAAKQRRLERLAATQPWRLPPSSRR